MWSLCSLDSGKGNSRYSRFLNYECKHQRFISAAMRNDSLLAGHIPRLDYRNGKAGRHVHQLSTLSPCPVYTSSHK